MALTYDGSTGLLTILGQIFGAQATINTVQLTTVPAQIDDIVEQLRELSVDLNRERLASSLPQATADWQSASSGLLATLRTLAGDLLANIVEADSPQAEASQEAYLLELIRQMKADTESVDLNAVSLTVTAGGSNVGNGVIVTSTKRGDGLVNENMLAEDVKVLCTDNSTAGSETLEFKGEIAETDKLSHNWPKGSGSSVSLTAVDAAGGDNLLSNGSFEDEDDLADAPDDWVVKVGTVGTTLKITNVEVQTLTVTGSPSAGHYRLTFTDASSRTQTTGIIDYDATASEVQTALRSLVGLEDITVTATGTSPNFTHTVTFTGVKGNVSALSVINNTTGGTITPAEVTAGSGHVFAGGKALEFDSNGSQLTEIYQVIDVDDLEPLTSYAGHLWMKVDPVPAAGALRIELYDGSAVINDEQGTANQLAIDATALTTSYVSKPFVFRTPKNLPPIIQFRIRISTAVSNTTSVFLDHLAFVEQSELYAGGPLATAFSGSIGFVAGEGQNPGDSWTIAVTNDRAGKFQEWFERNFNMRELGLLLPSAASETIDDALVA